MVIAWETGQVLDFQIMSKRCNVCTRKLSEVSEESDEFAAWWETHKDRCEKNHAGSSPAMEAEAALAIWKRSEDRLHLRFTQVISDGDSKTVAQLQEEKPYGENVTITKYECVGHIQKRVGKQLREVKKKVLAENRVIRGRMKGKKELLKEKEKDLKEKVKVLKVKEKESNKGVGRGRGRGKAEGEVGCGVSRVEEGGGRVEEGG